ncbi:MAG: hypothetical protein R2704_09985 [Microthrixaceae bacterium]
MQGSWLELCYPERETDLVGNLVYSNNNGDTPRSTALLAQRHRRARWRPQHDRTQPGVGPRPRTGIGLVPGPRGGRQRQHAGGGGLGPDLRGAEGQAATDPADVENPLLWNLQQNIVRDNVVPESGLADHIGSVETDLSELENCWADNDVTSSRPKDLQTLAP